MKLSLTNSMPIIALALGFLIGSLYVFAPVVLGNVTTTEPTVKPVQGGLYQEYTFFATSTTQTDFSTTTSATSTQIASWTDSNGRIDKGFFVIAGAKKATMYFTRTGVNGNGGSSRFRVQVSRTVPTAETDWFDYNQLIQSAATGTVPTSLSAVTISAATTTSIVSLNLQDHTFYAVRCIVLETTDGEHSCYAGAEF